jgi:betaine-aldehyde dehydrogenase
MALLEPRAKSSLPKERGLFYGGAWHQPKSGRMIEVFSPATGESLGSVADAGPDDVEAAVAAAYNAFPAWRDTTVARRAEILRDATALVREHAEELAYIDAIDSGNPFTAMMADVMLSCEYLEYFAGMITQMRGATIPVGPDVLNYTLREPLGVVARIAAFNHPILFSAGKTGAPLGSGNTLVLKPADQTPLSALRLAEIWKDVFPPGVFNVVNGGREAGVAVAEHPRVAKIGFIGSVNAGKAVMKSASGTLKKISLELGGKNALVACDDADPAEVADGIVRGMNFKSVTSQSCNSTSRAYVHEKIYEAVLPEVVKIVSRIKIGLPTSPDTEMGCLSSKAQFDKTMGYIKIAKDEGARLLYGGGPPADSRLAKGFFVEPTVFADVTDDMRIAREEVFGPVLSILKWRDDEDVISRVNAVDVGLTASIWTKNIDRAHRFASRIQAGYMWINDASVHYLGLPFGGYKQSGIGKEESFEELLECTQVKNVNIRLRPI